MDGPHEPLGTVGANRKKCEADFWKTSPDFGKVRAVSRIAGEKHCARGRFEDITAPQRFISVAQSPAGKVACRNRGDAD